MGETIEKAAMTIAVIVGIVVVGTTVVAVGF
mgnify:CR=1 FL=1